MLSFSEVQESTIHEIQYKIIILGRGTAGKTALLTRYKYGVFKEQGTITTTVDHFFFRRNNVCFNYYDTAGQDIFQAIVRSYYRQSDACIIVYDMTSPQSRAKIKHYLETVRQLAPKHCVVYLVGAKADLTSESSCEPVKKEYPQLKHFITSSKLNKGVAELFQTIEREIPLLVKKTQREKSIRHKDLKFGDTKKTDGKKCC